MSQQNNNEVTNAVIDAVVPPTSTEEVTRRSERKRKRPVTFYEEFKEDIQKVLMEGDKEPVADAEDLDDGQPRLDPEAPMASVYAMQIYEAIKRANAGTGISDAELWDMASEAAMFEQEVDGDNTGGGDEDDEYDSSFINDDSEEDYEENENEDEDDEEQEESLSSDVDVDEPW